MTPADYANHPHVTLTRHRDGTGVAYLREPGHGDAYVLRVVRVFTSDEMRQAEAAMAEQRDPRHPATTGNIMPDDSARNERARYLSHCARWLLVGAMLAAAVALTYIDVWPAYTGACVALAAVAFALLPVERAA